MRDHLLLLKSAFLVVLIFLISCSNKSRSEQNEFYYYPKANVYYSESKGQYLYSLNGGKDWDTFVSRQEPPAVLGNKIIVYSTTDSVWKDNDEHRKMYGGNLYNIAAEMNDGIAKTTDVSERKIGQVARHTSDNGVSHGEEKKHKIKRFFQKLFGRHKR